MAILHSFKNIIMNSNHYGRKRDMKDFKENLSVPASL